MAQSILSLMSREHIIKHDVIGKEKIYCFNKKGRVVSPTFADIIFESLMLQGNRQDVLNIYTL